MATISELVPGKKLGEIRIVRSDMSSLYFIPYFQTDSGLWYGLNSNGNLSCQTAISEWELYAEPKPKKTVYEWLIESGNDWVIASVLYTEAEAAMVFKNRIKKTGRQFEVDAC